MAVVGTFVTLSLHHKSVAYVTDRRLVRFEAHNPLFTSTRALSWDDTMKVKSYPPNILWNMLNIGTLVLHARASTLSFTKDEIQEKGKRIPEHEKFDKIVNSENKQNLNKAELFKINVNKIII